MQNIAFGITQCIRDEETFHWLSYGRETSKMSNVTRDWEDGEMKRLMVNESVGNQLISHCYP